MDDLDEIRAHEGRPLRVCGLGKLLADPTIEYNDQLSRAVASDIQARAIERWLTTKGQRIGYETVKRHRRGECCRG